MIRILLFIVFMSSWARAEELRQSMLALLPQDLRELDGSMSAEVLRLRFKEKIVQEDSHGIYLNFFGQHADVTLGLRAGQFAYLLIDVPHELAQQDHALLSLAKEDGAKVSSDARRIITAHEKQGVRLEFAMNDVRELKAIYLRAPEARKK